MIEVEVLEIDALPQERGDRFVAHTGFGPRAPATPYRWVGICPRRIQACRVVKELPDPRAHARRPLVGLTLGRARRVAGARRLHGPKRRGCLGSCAVATPRPTPPIR
jgi:hypothetical protein